MVQLSFLLESSVIALGAIVLGTVFGVAIAYNVIQDSAANPSWANLSFDPPWLYAGRDLPRRLRRRAWARRICRRCGLRRSIRPRRCATSRSGLLAQIALSYTDDRDRGERDRRHAEDREIAQSTPWRSVVALVVVEQRDVLQPGDAVDERRETVDEEAQDGEGRGAAGRRPRGARSRASASAGGTGAQPKNARCTASA